MLVFKKKGGNLVDKTRFLQEVGMLKDGSYEIVVFRKDRSSEQNRYLWAVYGYIADWSGYESEYIHEVMKHKFLLDSSRKVPVPRSTSSLNTKEFTDYIDCIRDFMAPLGCYIPSADEWKNAHGIA